MSNQTVPFYTEFLAGCFGGVAQVFIGQPFDIIKVRLQSAPKDSKLSAMQIFRDIIAKEGGPKALWKGSLPPLLGVAVCVSIQFGVNENVKKVLSHFLGYDKFSFAQLYGCGIVAGLANTVASVPAEHIRILMQTQSVTEPVYSGSIDCMKKIYKQYGLRGIYRGTPVTLVREAITFGTYFSVYAAMIDFFQSRSKDGELGMGEVILSGAVAGITLWPLCFPFDVIKTKLQTDSFTEPKFKNARDCARQMYSTFGWRGFFKGIAPCMLRAGPVNGGTFAAYTLAFNSLMLLQPQYQYAQNIAV